MYKHAAPIGPVACDLITPGNQMFTPLLILREL
jgi:hypothetical protein